MSQNVLMGTSRFQIYMISAWLRQSRASMDTCSTSDMVCWCTKETRLLINSKVLDWISLAQLVVCYDHSLKVVGYKIKIKE